MDRFLLFQRLLSLANDDFDITDAKMKNWSDKIEIVAKNDSCDIKIEVAINEKEDEDAPGQ